MTDLFQKVAKTHKGKLHLKKLQPKLIEGPRSILYFRSTKTSETVRKSFDFLVV